MNEKVAILFYKAALAGLSAVQNWRKDATPEQIRAFVDGVHASGGTVDHAVADAKIAETLANGAALDAELRAAG